MRYVNTVSDAREEISENLRILAENVSNIKKYK